MLWEPERHEPLVEATWDEAVAREGARELAADAERAFDRERLWPGHPLDDLQSGAPPTSFYLGASGVAWALAELGRRGALEPTRDWRAEARRFVSLHLRAPDDGELSASFFLGEVGVRMVADADHDRIYELVEGNIENESLELLWGAPGTMLAALFLFERTGEPRWRELYLRNAEFLLRTFEHHDDLDLWLWTQRLYGETVRLLGAGHGFAGNVFSLLRGAELLSEEQRAQVIDRASHTLVTTAQGRGSLVNWAPQVGTPRRGREAMLVQWCHGAPGMLTGLSRLPDREDVNAILTAAAELTWRAGPLRKGPGLCHGTAGNGHAFLAMHARTGDPVWLERARRFAMHALAQSRAAAAHHGQHRYSLWTGDLGVALYLQDCLDGAGRLPGLDYL